MELKNLFISQKKIDQDFNAWCENSVCCSFEIKGFAGDKIGRKTLPYMYAEQAKKENLKDLFIEIYAHPEKDKNFKHLPKRVPLANLTEANILAIMQNKLNQTDKMVSKMSPYDNDYDF